MSLGLPIWSAQQWLRFTATRHSARFGDVCWHPSRKKLTLRLMVDAAESDRLTVLPPRSHGDHRWMEVRVAGGATSAEVQAVGGVVYAATSLSACAHELVARYR